MANTLNLFPSRIRFTNADGTLTPEAYRALQTLVERSGGILGDNGVDVFGDLTGSGSQDSSITDTVTQPSQPAIELLPDVVQPVAAHELDFAKARNGLTVPKTSGVGIKVDVDLPGFGWRDLLGALETRPAAGGGATAIPDFVVYRGSIYDYRFGTVAPNDHLHEAFINYHIPHDYVPGTDMYLHVHWSQIVVDTGGAAAVPGVAKWYLDFSYADGHGTPGGAADPFPAPKTISVTQQGSTTQYGHMIAEVAFTNNGGDATHVDRNTIQVDGVIQVRIYRNPADAADTLNQDTFVHYVDVHYQSTNVATKNKVPSFYA